MTLCGCPINAPEADPAVYPCPCGDHCPEHALPLCDRCRKPREDGGTYAGRSLCSHCAETAFYESQTDL